MKTPGSTKRILVAAIRAQLASGTSATRVMEEMELSESEFKDLLDQMYEEDQLTRVEKTPERIFIDYCLRQEGVIKDLDRLIKRWLASNQPQAVVGAARAKSEIIDRMLRTGQDLGLINRVAEKHLVIAGIAVADLSDSDLRNKVATELEAVRAVMSRFGETDILGAKPLPMLSGRTKVKPVSPKQRKPEEGESSTLPHRAKGGLSKSAGGHATAKRHEITRKKPAQPPPDSSSLASETETG